MNSLEKNLTNITTYIIIKKKNYVNVFFMSETTGQIYYYVLIILVALLLINFLSPNFTAEHIVQVQKDVLCSFFSR